MNDPLYIQMSDKPISHTIDIAYKGQVMVDFAADGTIVGVEILDYEKIQLDGEDVKVTRKD